MELAIISKVVAIVLASLLASPCVAQGNLKTHTVEIGQRPEAVIARLATELNPDMRFLELNDGFVLSYAGMDLPPALRAFLTQTILDLDPTAFNEDKMVNISVALVPIQSGTQVRLMMMGQESTATALPQGAEVLLAESVPAACSGQMVLSHAGGVPENTQTYVSWAKAAGFKLTDASDASLSFFIGYRPNCSIFIYIQPDPEEQNRSTVVVRYLED